MPQLSVVGIDASVGGLIALRTFFSALPTDTGMTFVVEHLSSEHETNLTDLLQPHTAMPVTLVTGRVKLQRNHVYIIPPAKRPQVTESHLDLAEEAVRAKSIFELEHRARRIDDTLGWTLSQAVPLLDANGEIVEWFGAASDMTARKQAEEALRESERNFRVLADSIPQLAWMADENGWIFWYNQRWYEYTGTTLKEMQGWGWQAVHHPEHVERVVERIRRSFETGEPWEDTFPLRSKSGEYRWFLSRALPIRNEQGRVVRWFGTNTDVTEQREAEEALRQLHETLEAQVEERTDQVRRLITELTMSEQAERRRISQILHDDLQQRLYGIQFQLTLLGNDLNAGRREDAPAVIDEIRKHVDIAVQTARSLSIDLSPPVLHHEGLAEAVLWLATQMQRQHGLTVHVQRTDDVPVPEEDLRVLLFQVMRELLFNVVKYAGVSEVVVSLARVDHHILIEIVDQGQGFDVDAVLGNALRSHGLLQNQRRLELVDCHMQIESRLGEGTRIVIECPVSHKPR